MSIFQFQCVNQQPIEMEIEQEQDASIFDLQQNAFHQNDFCQQSQEINNNKIFPFQFYYKTNKNDDQQGQDQNQTQKAQFQNNKVSLTQQFLKEAVKVFELTQNLQYQQIQMNKNKYIKQFARNSPYSWSFIDRLYRIWLKDPLFYKHDQYVLQCQPSPLFKSLKSPTVMYRENRINRTLKRNPLLTINQLSELLSKDKSCSMKNQKGEIIYLTARVLFNIHRIRKISIRLISSKRNLPTDIVRRKKYCSHMQKQLDNGAKFIYVDQFIINKFAGRTQASIKRSMNCSYIANVMANIRDQSFILLAVINQTGKIKYEVLLGDVSDEKYKLVLNKLLKYQLQQYKNDQKFLVLHEAIAKQARQLIKQVSQTLNLKLKWLPAFSPQLNPLDYWFWQINELLKRQQYVNDKQLINYARYILQDSMPGKKFKNLYLQAHSNFQKGINQQDF